MKPSRILIVTSGPLCRNPRVLKEATALGGAGYDTTVLTIANLGRFEAYDHDLLRNAPFRKIALDHCSSDRRTAARRLASRFGTWVARRAVRFGVESAQALGPAWALGRRARAFPADLTIVHTELPLWIGAKLLARGRRVAVDFEDWHSEDLLPDVLHSRPLRLLRQVESLLMRNAAYVSTTSHTLATALQADFGGRRPMVVTNSFPLQPRPPQKPGGLPSFFWFSQTIGPGRGLELFISAWRLTRQPSRLCLLGEASDAYREKLRQRLPLERRPLLEFLPLTSPEALPGIIARHDIGLALEPTVPLSRDYTITNKILQYLNAGLAVLASNTAGQREVMGQAPGCGLLIALTETEELARLLDRLLADREQIARMGENARRAAEEIYCWEKEAPRVVGLAAAALRGSP